MGKLRITSDGIRVEGEAEFLKSIYAAEIRAQRVSIGFSPPLFFSFFLFFF